MRSRIGAAPVNPGGHDAGAAPMPENDAFEDAEFVDVETGELVPYEKAANPAPMNLFGAGSPAEVVARSVEVANELTKIIRDRGLFSNISGRSHVKVEGWTLLGSMLGVFPVVEWTRELPNGWEARVEVKTLAGAVVGAAEAECLRTERNWADRDDYALRSMAQTRAVSKAMRAPLGFIVQLAGFDATPEAEMGGPDVAGPAPDAPASDAQKRKLGVLYRELERVDAPEGYGDWVSYCKAYMLEQFGKQSRAKLTKGEAHRMIDHLESLIQGQPF